MSEIETEIAKATKFKPPKGGYPNRQDHLAALARASNKLTDDEFDELSDDAANWLSTAIKALNARAEIEDFEDVEEAEETDEETEESEATPEADAKAEAENEAEEAAQEAKTTKPKKGAKKAPKEPKPVRPKQDLSRYDKISGERDRYGVMIGTKTHDAVLMYEKGVTGAQIFEKLQGRFFNILRDLGKKGHRVEKLPGGIFKLTHQDDVPKNKGKKA